MKRDFISDPEQIADIVDAWHEGNIPCDHLHDALGWTWDQYASWVESSIIPPPPLQFTAEQSAAANKEWKATCGPHVIAAALGITLEEVRAALEGYKGWMSPTQVTTALNKLGSDFRLVSGLKTMDLCDGISRIQWEGPWLDPGKPKRIAYFHTHYVAHFRGMVLCTACLPAEWIPVEGWRKHLLESEPASPFHVTHHWIL